MNAPSQIKTPALFVHGIYDVNARYGAAKDLAAQIAGAAIFEFDGSHFGMITHEDVITMAILDFLARHVTKDTPNF